MNEMDRDIDGGFWPRVIPDRDFDRGFVQMSCDKREEGCSYGFPHYHCQICGSQVNDDELARREFHPCCSQECILAYNQ